MVIITALTAAAQNQNISNGFVFDGEPYLSVNPNNQQHMVVAWMGFVPFNKISIKTKVTFNSGKTWSDAINLPHTVSSYTSADPSIEFDNEGNVYLSYIDYTGYDAFPIGGAVYICRSTNGGLSWDSPVEVISIDSDPGKRAIDRPWMSIDRSSGQNKGNIYITTMNAKGATIGYHPYFMVSTDGGSSFNNWRYLDTTNWLSGIFIPQPMPTNCITSNGDFYAVYPSYVFMQNPLSQFIIAASADAGNSFGYNSVFASSTNVSDSLAKMGYLLRSNPSNNSHLAFFYLDGSLGDLDVFFTESFNKGITWTEGKRINDDAISNNKMQDLVWADFDDDGDLVVSWRDRRNSNDSTFTTSSEIWAAIRLKNSNDFSPNFPLSNQIVVYDSMLSVAGNDFMCIKFNNDTINAVWGDTRTGKLNIWFQRTTIDGNLLSVKLLSEENIPIVNIFPNPFVSEITVAGQGVKQIKIYSQTGKLISSHINSFNNYDWSVNLSALSSGNYIAEIITANGITYKKIMKL